MNRLALILLLITLSFAAYAANTPPPGNTGNIITNGGSGRYDIYTVGPGLQVVGKELRATSTSSASPSGIFPQIQYNDGAGNFAPLTEYTAAAYAAHNTIMNGLAYDPRDTQYGALCGGFNLFSGNGTTATFNYTIPFTGSSSTDNSGFFVYIETNGFASATILTTADFTVTGVNSGVGGTITLNTPPVAGSTLIVVHDDGPGLIATSTASVASGGYISVPHGCTMYTDAAAGTALADNVQVIGQGFTPNYAQQEQTMKPILYVIAPTGHVPAVGFNISNKNKQFFEGFEITTHIPGASNQFGFQTVPALIGVVGNTGAGGGTLPGITAQYMTFNYGNVGFGAPKSGTAQYIFSTLRFNTFSANDAGVYGPLSDQQIYGNNFDQNGQFGTYGNSGGMVIGPQQGAPGSSGASRIEFNRFEFNLEGIVVKAGSLITMDGNEFDSNYGCGLDLFSSWDNINIDGGWFRANGTNSTNGTGNTTAGRDAHVCINGAGNNLHITGTNFLNGYVRGYQQPIGTASANTPLYLLDVNTAGSGVNNISVVNANIENTFTGSGAYVRDFAIYRNGKPTNIKINASGQASEGLILSGRSSGQGRGLSSNSWSSYVAIGDANTPGSQYVPTGESYPFILGNNLNIGPTLNVDNTFSEFECDIINNQVFPKINPESQHNPLITWLPSLSDPGFGSGSTTHRVVTEKCRIAALSWMGIPKQDKVYGQASGCVATGTWTNDNSYNGNYGITSSTQGDSLACTTTTNGGPLYGWYQLKGNDGGTFTWSLDGTTTGTVATNGITNDFTFPMTSAKRAVAAVRIPVQATGSHTVTFALTSTTSVGNTATILGIGTPPEKAYVDGNPTIFIFGQPYEAADTFSASTAAYNNDIRIDADQLRSDGISSNFIDVRNSICCNTTLDLTTTASSSYPLSLSAQGHQHLADAAGAVIQYEKTPGGIIDPRDYGAACNTQLLSGTFTTGNNVRYVTTVAASNQIGTAGVAAYKWQPGTATCGGGGGGDVGKVISLFGEGGQDIGPTTYIASVDPASNKATLGNGSWLAGFTNNKVYAVFGGCPSNANDPSTAHDDTTGIHNASLANSVVLASGSFNFSATGGAVTHLPTNCLVHGLQLADHTALVGNNGSNTYDVAGTYNNANSNVTRLFVASNGFAEDPSTGIDFSSSRGITLRDFTISSVVFPFIFRGTTLSCIGSMFTGTFPLEYELMNLDHVTATLCPVGVGVPLGVNQQVNFTASIADNGDGTSTMAVSSVDSNNIVTNYAGTTTPNDWLALNRTVSGPSVTTGTKITAVPTGGANGNYTLDHALTVSSTGLISPAIRRSFTINVRDSLIETNGVGINGSLSDSDINDTWFTNNFHENLYLGPPGDRGAGTNYVLGGREETGGTIVFDGATATQFTGFQCQQSPTCFIFKGAWRNIQLNGGLLQGGGSANSNANDKAMIQIGGTGSQLDINGVAFGAWSPYGTTKYMAEMTTGSTADFISIEGGSIAQGLNSGTFTSIWSPANPLPIHYSQDIPQYPKTSTMFIPATSGLSLTSTSGGIYSEGGLAGTTTVDGTFNITGLPTAYHNWNCEGGDSTIGNNWPMTATTSTSCALRATTTSGNSVWFQGTMH